MATVPSLATQSAGGIATAAWANSVKDAVTFFTTELPVAQGRQTATQSLANNTWAGITFTTEDVDRDGMHSTSSNTSRWTAGTAGRYEVSGVVAIDTNGTGQRGSRVAVNGTAINGSRNIGPASSAAMNVPQHTVSVLLSPGDYIELQGFQSSGGALSTFSSSEMMSLVYIRWVGTT